MAYLKLPDYEIISRLNLFFIKSINSVTSTNGYSSKK